jgi:cell division cycle 20-like protein 1, cofactor of APC complex
LNASKSPSPAPSTDPFETLPIGSDGYAEKRQEGAGRKIAKQPFKVLDAPNLQDDFYLNLVDWSSTNCLSVGLSSCV